MTDFLTGFITGGVTVAAIAFVLITVRIVFFDDGEEDDFND